MRLIENAGLRAMRMMDPERAHGIAIKALQMGLGPKRGPFTSDRLRTTLAGLDLPNPIGLAAGFDKNATALRPLSRCGFGFLEVGAITPRAQAGNPQPRLFRLKRDRAAINRFGFNNKGMELALARLTVRPKGVIGLNLGANKDSEDRSADFSKVLAYCGEFLDFATVNVSSPNTESLRDLQGKAALAALLDSVMQTNAGLDRPVSIFLKIAPDLDEAELDDVAAVADASGISGIITTNTTLDRVGLHGQYSREPGGLSGQPLFEKSTRVLAQMSQRTNLPLIGVGGVASAAQAYAKIRAGASAVQLYTALVYGGISLVDDIARGLDTLLEKDGFANVSDAVGTGRADYL
jgi:dihydroorotate dehydrogenase